MQVFKSKHYFKDRKKRFLEGLETVVKSCIILVKPVPIALWVVAVWYHTLYKNDIHLYDGVRNTAEASWIPTFGVLWALVLTLLLATVWSEYKTTRMAVKKYDFETFIDLRDEELSPLMHIIMLVLASTVVVGFMLLKYSEPWSGAMFIGSLSYLAVLFFEIVSEIDDPCSGVWFIKGIPEEWLKVDPKLWREKRCKHERKKFIDACKRLTQPPVHH